MGQDGEGGVGGLRGTSAIFSYNLLMNYSECYISIMTILSILCNVTVYRKTGHNNAACVNIEKRSIDFFKMYCFKPREGNG